MYVCMYVCMSRHISIILIKVYIHFTFYLNHTQTQPKNTDSQKDTNTSEHTISTTA